MHSLPASEAARKELKVSVVPLINVIDVNEAARKELKDWRGMADLFAQSREAARKELKEIFAEILREKGVNRKQLGKN